ncbi:hypothetical protein LTR94_033983, partial [Friedmanniomyces endolithicus]
MPPVIQPTRMPRNPDYKAPPKVPVGSPLPVLGKTRFGMTMGGDIALPGGDPSVAIEAGALPGGFVAIDEPLEAAAERVLHDKAGLSGGSPEQVHCFGAVDRDPRMRIISIAYRVLLDPARMAA